MGLLCAHIIKERFATCQSLSFCDIYKHWWIKKEQSLEIENDQIEQVLKEFHQKYDFWLVLQQEKARAKLLKMIQEPPLLLLEPTITCTRERLTESQNDAQSSTQRISSVFEREELKTTAKKCGICHNIGHNSRTCSDSS
ncbi:16734_t:CDS:1 [Cetraspora pellucida]|uniref:16734_t:CDS:1 n=1 Tax=Cetraspora pellucida TaxID=1433469 RepID=A0A9N9H725_9GLOM|nr:16734_t:CDS:1 [Cetraspora pellucida]